MLLLRHWLLMLQKHLNCHLLLMLLMLHLLLMLLMLHLLLMLLMLLCLDLTHPYLLLLHQ
jgi:hypothetical protein